jgi:phosphate transport system permease protein
MSETPGIAILMNPLSVAIVLLVLVALAYQVGLVRSRRVAGATAGERLHSRPVYHGLLAVLRAAVPAALVYVLWRLVGGPLIDHLVLGSLPPAQLPADDFQRQALLQRVANLASGFGAMGEAQGFEQAAAETMARLRGTGQAIVAAAMATAAAAGLAWTWRSTTPATRARNKVERAVHVALIACSAVAVLTTVGIVLSMLGEAVRFFQHVRPTEFFFGTVWNPRFSTVGSAGQSGFGMLPLMAGTLMIAAIAMLVAVPLGLMTAIYLSEYASHATRTWAKRPSRCWPASRPSSTASSRSSRWGPSCRRWASCWGCRSAPPRR